MALGRLGASRISSFEDGTVESDLCRDNYEPCVRECLEDGSWNWAERRRKLAKRAQGEPDFDFCYELPVDHVAPRWIMDDTTGFRSQLPYRISEHTLLTDLDNARLVYTFRAPEASFSGMFVPALMHLLCSRLAGPINEDVARIETEYKLYRDMIARARSRNGQQDSPERFDVSTFIAAHTG